MTKIHWIVRETTFPSRTAPLIEELHRQGYPVQVVTPHDQDLDHLYPPNTPVMAYGGSRFIQTIQQLYHPGAIATFENFKTESYLPHYHPYLLNKEARVVTVQELLQKTRYQRHYGPHLFIRPNSSTKPFSGGIFSLEHLEGYDWVQTYSGQVLINHPLAIRAEWRTLVANRQVICGGCYTPQLTDYLPPEVITFVQSLSIEWEPDPIYVVDICHAEGHLHVMELNPFSCSDYYRCPVEPIITWANAIAYQRLS